MAWVKQSTKNTRYSSGSCNYIRHEIKFKCESNGDIRYGYWNEGLTSACAGSHDQSESNAYPKSTCPKTETRDDDDNDDGDDGGDSGGGGGNGDSGGDNDDDSRGILDQLSSLISDIKKAISDAISSAIKALVDGILGAFDSVINSISESVSGVISSITETFSSMVEKVNDFIEGVIDDVKSVVDSAISNIYDLVSGALNYITEIVTDIREWISDTFTVFVNAVQTIMSNVSDFIESTFSTFVGYIEETFSNVIDWVDETFTSAYSWLEQIFEQVSTSIVELLDESVIFLKDGFDGIVLGVQGIVDDVLESSKQAIESVGDFAEDVSQSITGLTNQIKTTILPLIKGLAGTFFGSTLGFPYSEMHAKAEETRDAWERTFDTLIASEIDDVNFTDQLVGKGHTTTIGGIALSAFIIVFAQAALAAQVGQATYGPKFEEFSQKVWEKSPVMKLSVAEAGSLYARGFISKDLAIKDARQHGYDDYRISAVLKSYETPIDVDRDMAALRRGLIDETTFKANLIRSGYNEGDIQTIFGFRDIIPGPNDLISMAVREAFTPDVVSEFQLEGDFPEEFGLWAGKQGLTIDWAKKYWVAHWRLPSANQGFEMFHRRKIDDATLDKLLKALDVSPFWRDKLKAIAYNPVTRVDIRRMYKLKLIDVNNVYERHLDLGYSPSDAQAMTSFVQAYSGDDEDDEDMDIRSITLGQIKALEKMGTITADYAVERVHELGYTLDMSKVLVDSWKTSRDIKDRKDLVDRAIRKALRERLTPIQTEQLVYDIDLTDQERMRIAQVLRVESRETDNLPSKTELKKMLESGFISTQIWGESMQQMGYSDYWINIYAKLYGFEGGD